ncbi:MAG: BamA/TamA family outer membrane protein [Flammeovirgaceae bacterium]|nr:BamA/TamA family outer membrane protein [Flammeovirgaceae bacterium]
MLYSQSVVAPKGFDKTGTTSLYEQNSNRKIPLLPIHSLVWMYYMGVRHYNYEKFYNKKVAKEAKFDRKIEATDKEQKKANILYHKQKKIAVIEDRIENGNLFMQWGEPVSVYDTINVKITKERLDNFLFINGYFNGNITARIGEKKKLIAVKYELQPNRAYFFDSIIYQIQDSAVLNLVLMNEKNGLIKLNERFSQSAINKERERIDLLLKDNGYFDFSRQYIHFEVDSTISKGKVAIRYIIENPAGRNSHHVFKIDSIVFTTDAAIIQQEQGLKKISSRYRDITFSYYKHEYSRRLLSHRVFIWEDSLYNRQNTFNTQRQLANLDVFKFVNINYDSSGGKFVANIFTSPLDKYSWSNEAGLKVTQGLPGPFYSLTFKKRNLFGGLEILEIDGRFGFEGVSPVTSSEGVYQSFEAGANLSVTFPQFLFPLGPTAGARFGKYNPKTRLLAGYNYTNRPEYTRSAVTISDTYLWDRNRKVQYQFTLFNINVINSKLDPEFDSLLNALQTQQGNNLINSFKPSLVSSMIFTMIWNPKNYGNDTDHSYLIRIQGEAGGTLFNFYTPQFAINQGLEIFKYLRASFDYRTLRIINRNTSLAFHINAGAGYAYGDNNALPYEKYFFAGGSNSIRAWRPRRLGLGSAPPPLAADPVTDGTFDYQYERPGAVLLESSIELRKNLFGFVQGAVFLDAGNVWLFDDVIQNSDAGYSGNTKFKLNGSLRELGVGTGFGLRFDFSFLVLRFDVGIKMYDPARMPGDRFVLDRVKFFNPFAINNGDGTFSNIKEPVIYNIGIGYPF